MDLLIENKIVGLPQASALLRSVCAHGLHTSRLSLPDEPVDDERWLDLSVDVTGQRVWGLLADAAFSGAFACTDHQLETALSHAEISAIGSLLLDRLLVQLDDAFAAEGVDYRVYKGAANARLLYPRPALRTYSDVDLVVPGAQFDLAAAVLESLDARRQNPDPRPGFVARFGKSAAFTMPGGWEVDVHRVFHTGPFGMGIDSKDLLVDPQVLVFAGRRLRALNREAQLIGTAMHAVLPGDQRRLVPLRDVAQIVENDEVDLDRAVDFCRRWRCGIVVAAAVVAAVDVFALDADTDLVRWAGAYQPTNQERRWLDTALGDHRRQILGGYAQTLEALPSWTDRAGYVRATVWHDNRASWPQRVRRVRRRLTGR